MGTGSLPLLEELWPPPLPRVIASLPLHFSACHKIFRVPWLRGSGFQEGKKNGIILPLWLSGWEMGSSFPQDSIGEGMGL